MVTLPPSIKLVVVSLKKPVYKSTTERIVLRNDMMDRLTTCSMIAEVTDLTQVQNNWEI